MEAANAAAEEAAEQGRPIMRVGHLSDTDNEDDADIPALVESEESDDDNVLALGESQGSTDSSR